MNVLYPIWAYFVVMHIQYAQNTVFDTEERIKMFKII